jgi:hypothetical protein
MACPKDMDLEANAIVGYIYIFLEKLPTKNLKDIYILACNIYSVSPS